MGQAPLHGQWKAPCGTAPGKSEWLKNYQRAPQAYPQRSDSTLYVPLTIHIVGTDNGAGYFRIASLKEAFCKLNGSYSEANIQFFIKGDIRYHNNSAWYSHDSVLEGADMMFASNVDSTLNIYFVSDPAGNCGYNLPYAGIAMSKGCSGPNDNTWAHEIGHALRLPHPFLGWEGGISYDGSIPPAFDEPAPALVTYDYTFFQDTLIEDTLIIDTAFVELVDGSNCAIAADGFCDTPPDYLAQRWFCNGDGLSSVEQTDPNGEVFRSDGSLIMGYSDDACQARFTPGQIAAMRANLFDEKPEWISQSSPQQEVASAAPELLAPIDGDITPVEETVLAWEAVANATHYVVEVSPIPTFGIRDEYIAAANTLTLTGLAEERTYYWRVSAYNAYSFCSPVSPPRSFTASSLVNAVQQLGRAEDIFRVYPSPVRSGAAFIIEGPAGTMGLYRSDGALLHSERLQNTRTEVPTNGLPSGIYYLKITAGNGTTEVHALPVIY